MAGKFIVVEGLEGAGKSTAIQIIIDQLQEQGIDPVCTREPGGTPMAEAIRNCVKQDWQEQVTTEAELLLMYASRAQLVENIILPALQQGQWVLGDRHDMSSQAYQGGGRQVEQTVMDNLKYMTLKGFKPDLTLYLDVEPEVGLARARSRGELDRIEQQDIGFFQRTRERYLALTAVDSNAELIDTMQPLEQVHDNIRQALRDFLSEQ